MPIAPAPYAAPAAYYFPRIPRMSAVEVSKGPAAIKYGPQTVAGAISMLSEPIPDATGRVGGKLDLLGGDFDTFRGHGLDRRVHRDGARLRRGAQPRDAAGEQLGLQGARLGRRHGLQDPGLRGQGRAAAGGGLGRGAVARAEAAVFGRGVGRNLRRPDARRLPRRSAAALPGQPARRAERRALDLPGDAPDRLHRPARPDDDRVRTEDRAGLVQAERRPQCRGYRLHEPERDPRGPRDLCDRVRGDRRRARHVERGGRAPGAQQQSRVLRDRRADGARLLVRGLGRRAPARGVGPLPRGRGGPLPERRPLPDGRRPDAV